ncbi:hypothetical protein V6N13_057237 [Hibiscus sabdariffa]|uniref:Uncharacterized protein n=1 Tax=Hibiscus sabdariffa TaxID=183260 RepID=A0ABR2CWS9_9ROSI
MGEPVSSKGHDGKVSKETLAEKETVHGIDLVVTRSRSTKGVNSACKNDTGYEAMPNSITELRDFILKNVQDFHHHVSRPSYRYRKPYPAWIDSVPFPPGSEKTTYARKAKERLYLLYLKRIVIDAEITKGYSLPKTTTPTRGNSRPRAKA